MDDITTVSIRPARVNDGPSLSNLATQLGYPSTADQIRNRFEILQARPEEDIVLVAEFKGQVVGWVHAHTSWLLVDAPDVEIGGLVVEKRIQDKGIGRVLMNAAENWAREHGYDSIYLRSNIIRTQAHEFYKRIGYEIIKSQYAFRKFLE